MLHVRCLCLYVSVCVCLRLSVPVRVCLCLSVCWLAVLAEARAMDASIAEGRSVGPFDFGSFSPSWGFHSLQGAKVRPEEVWAYTLVSHTWRRYATCDETLNVFGGCIATHTTHGTHRHWWLNIRSQHGYDWIFHVPGTMFVFRWGADRSL